MTRTTTDLRRAVEGLGYDASQETRDEIGARIAAVNRALANVLRLLPEGDEPVYLVTAGELEQALTGLWRTLWVESAALGWHYQCWFDEDVARQFDDGTLAQAILSRLGGGS